MSHPMPALPAFSVPLTRESVARWLAARDGAFAAPPALGASVPLPFLFFLRMQPHAGVSIHALLGRDPDRGLFGGARYQAAFCPGVGTTLDAAPRVADRKLVPSPRGDMAITTLEVSYSIRGGHVCLETARMIDLPKADPAAPAQPAARGPVEPTDLPKVADIAPVSRVQVAWMTVETGDMNPLHLDPVYARSRGHADVVLPGPLVVALIDRELARVAGGALVSLDVRLRAPSHPGEPLALHARQEGGAWRFRLYAAGDELRAEGSAATKQGTPHN